MIGIIGSGFGLYGYLPVVLANVEEVMLLTRAKANFALRPELQCFSDKIQWIDETHILIKEVSTLIISVPPSSQFIIVNELAREVANVKNLILEKPIASTPELSISLLNNILNGQFNFRVGYSFLYTNWFVSLQNKFKALIQSKLHITIIWNFKAHHFRNDLSIWKRYTDQGGGVIRFFGIHLIAVLSALGFDKVSTSFVKGFDPNQHYFWEFNCVGFDNKHSGRILVDSNSEQELFQVFVQSNNNGQLKDEFNFTSSGPFDQVSSPSKDVRNSVLSHLFSDLMDPHKNYYQLYLDINRFWDLIEQESQFLIDNE